VVTSAKNYENPSTYVKVIREDKVHLFETERHNIACNVQAAEKALRAAHLSQDRNRMPSYQTTDLRQLTIGLTDADLSDAVTQLTALLKDADYLRYPHRHTSPSVPRDVVGWATKLPAIQLTRQLLHLCQQFIERQ